MAKIGVLKPFRGNKADLSNIVLENGEIAFATDAGAIYFGDGVNVVKDLTPFIYAGGTDISDIGTGTITNAISTLNSNKISTICSTKSDANDVSGNKIEIFSVSTGTANSPGAGYWTILSIPYGIERIRQIAIGGYDKDGPIVKVRLSEYNSSNPGEPDWGPWHQVTVQ